MKYEPDYRSRRGRLTGEKAKRFNGDVTASGYHPTSRNIV